MLTFDEAREALRAYLEAHPPAMAGTLYIAPEGLEDDAGYLPTWGAREALVEWRDAMDPKAVPRVMAAINQVSAVLPEGTAGIDSPRYLSWHATASETLRSMMDALQAGDGAESWRLFTAPGTGFNELGAACQGCEGW